MTSGKIEITAQELRTDFPEFDSVIVFPDSTVNLYINRSYHYISQNTIGIIKRDSRRLAIELMACHLLTLWKKRAAGGSSVTSINGQVSSASIDSVSISLTPPPNRDQFSYWLNLTPYGQELLYLLGIYASGGLYIGGSRQRVL